MKLRSLVIDGADNIERIDSGELPSGLVVVYSPDEERKATALTMVRRLLFSANGNGHAKAVGTAHLSGSNGDFHLTTNGAPNSETFRRSDGAAADDHDLGKLFGGSERARLGDVLDVSDRELPREIFATPPQQAVRLDPAATSSLQKRMREILGDHDEGELPRLIAQLRSTEEELAAALEREQAYFVHRRAELEATADVGRLCADLADLRRRRERLKHYAQLWPTWVKRKNVTRELDKLENIDDFPETDLSISEAQDQSRDADRELRTLHKSLRQARAELDTIPEAGDRHQFVEEIDALMLELPDYRKRMTSFTRARARHDEISTLAPELGARVEQKEEPADFDPDGFDLDTARDWLTRSERINEQEAETRNGLAAVRASLKQLRNERQRAIRAAKSLRTELDDSDEYWRALWSLRDDLEELWEVQSQGEAAARAAETRLEALEGLDRRMFRIPDNRLRGALWVVVACSFVGALWMTRQEEALNAMLFGAACAIGITVDFALGWRGRWAQLRNAATFQQEEKLRHELDRARQRRDARWRAADEITRRIENAARALSLPATPNLQDVDSAEEKLFEASRKLATRGPLAETALAIHDQRAEEEGLMNQLREMREVREANALEWEEWKRTAGLPADLEQSGLTTFLCEYDRLRELSEEADQVDVELRDLAPWIEGWEDKARGLLLRAGARIHAKLCGRELEDQLALLRESAHRSARFASKRAELTGRIAEFEAEEPEVAGRSRQFAELFRSLRDRAGTTDEAEFERRRGVFRKRRELQEQIEEHEVSFTELLAELKLEDGEELRAELDTGDADAWAEESHRVGGEIDTLEETMEAASHHRTAAANECAEIEKSSSVDVTEQQVASLREEIRELANEWRRLALAYALIEEAQRGMSDRSVLLDQASSTLRNVTLGELVRVTAPDEEGAIRVVDRAGNQYTLDDDLPAAWLRQLALSLRLGLVREAAQSRDALPVVVDEVLSELDDERALATANEIHRLAGDQQVFYFTSRESSVEALSRSGEVGRVLRV